MLYSRYKNRRLDLSYRYKVTTLVFMGNLLSQLAIDLYTPSMPFMRVAFHTTSSYIQLSLTTYMFGYGMLQIVFGYFADKFGRRPTMLSGYIGFLIATFLILRTHSIVYFLLFRFLQGASGAAFQVIMRTTFRDLFHGIELSKVSGYYSTLWAVVPILAPTLGGYIQHYFGWQMHFKIMLGLCAFLFLLTWSLLPETKSKAANVEALHFFSALQAQLKNHTMLLFAIIVSLPNAIILAYIAVAPFLLQSGFLLSPITFGWLAFAITVFNMLGAFITGKFIENIGSRKLIVYTSALMTLGLLSMLLLNLLNSHNLLYILIPIAIVFFAIGALYPAAAGKVYMEINANAGIGVALFGTILIVITATGVGIVSFLPHHTLLPFVYFSLLTFALTLVILFYLRRKL